ncbi:ABC-2 type transport system permease protein [Deinococcus metalli]|uniref:ABC-2 type transport system permease protein n=1 Tax=Deinococcus metalli TaxID=1141878 RepID=A0A7W8KEL7_9DEIO|nr:ABC transporter permease subunit [Deinococcus metalli]MBB5375104.1 ABC-2 type transport system permease protein [Deinococcus metalli]GHF31558.1 hypothetical protein GCM10017781_04940 [Deinococcus metalli]
MTADRAWLELWQHALADHRRAWLGWSAGLLAYTLLVLAFYPTVKNDPSVNEIVQNLPDALKALFGTDFTSPAGYMGGRLYSLMPALLSVYAGLTGAALIAGDEGRGWLEGPLAQPVSRGALLLGRTLALLTLLLALGGVLFVASWGLGQVFQAPLPASRVLETSALFTLGAWVFGALALAVGAATGRPGLAAGVGAGLGVGLMVLHTLSAQVPALRDAAWLNPWTVPLRDAPLTHAVSPAPLIACAVVGLVLVGLARPLFTRRDIGG